MSAHALKHYEHHHADTGARLVWILSSNRLALSAHLLVESFAQWTQILNRRYSPCAGCIVMPQKMLGSR